MTTIDPRTIRAIVDAGSNVDGGCGPCFRALIDDLAERIPDVPWADVAKEHHDVEWAPGSQTADVARWVETGERP